MLNLLMPVILNQLSRRQYIRTGIAISGLLGIFWFTLAAYFYYLEDYPKVMGALISSGISFGGCFIVWLVIYYYQKMAREAISTVIKEVVQVTNILGEILKPKQAKLTLVLFIIIIGYFSLRKKN